MSSDTVQQMTDALIQLLQPTVMLVMTYLGAKFAAWFKRKTNIDAQHQVESILDRAIDYAEERARDWLKAQGAKMPGNRKLDIALAFAMRELTKRGLAKSAGNQVKDWIESLLHARRPQAFLDENGKPLAHAAVHRVV